MKPGYKKTEIGVIPEDWDIGSLKDAFPKLGAGVSVNSDESIYSDYYVLKTSAVRDGKVNITESKAVVRSDYSRLKCPVRKGTIIISRMNTPAMVGECGFSTIDAPNTFLPDRLWQVEPRSIEYDFQWLNYLLNTEKYSAEIRATATGTSNSMKNIAKDRLLEIIIPKPPLPEQQRIAKALLEIDQLIASLEKMIAKKTAIKQGVMQELLTGRHRLPGFSREWRTNRLAELAEFPTTCISLARIDSRDYVGTENMIPHVGGIRDNTIALESNFVREFRKNDILLSNIRPYLQKIWYADKNGGCSNDVLVIRSISDEVILSQYLFFLLSQQSFFDEIMSYAIGTKMPRGDKAVIKSYQVTYPCDIKEQEAIISVLSSMDLDISALNDRLNKAHQIKQGMMQQLLTGNIRLV